jgi:gentisate 1,2-dioxygenase
MVRPVARNADEDEYYDRINRLNVIPYWRADTEGRLEDGPVPYVWRWSDLYRALLDSVELVDVGRGAAKRRVLRMVNPGRRPLDGVTHTLHTTLQMIMPGEVAPAHRHSFAALRFVISGHGAYTVVDGEKYRLEPGALLLTPNWTWHDHGNDGSEPTVWLDALDLAFVKALRATFYEEYPGQASQPVAKPDSESHALFGTGTMLPPKERPSTLYSPLMLYRWQEAYDGLKRLQRVREDPCDGTILEYMNPLSGGHVLPTMACYLQLIKPGVRTNAHRHTNSVVCFVARGAGRSIVDGQVLQWEQNDTFVVPSWKWHEHEAHSSEEVVLFSIDDTPILESFGLLREEVYFENGGHQPI